MSMSKRTLVLVALILVVPTLALCQRQRGGGQRTNKSTVPVLNSISPTSATGGGGAFTLTANGSGFTSGTVVLWNGGALATTYISDTKLTAAAPASLIAAPGIATIAAYTSGRYGGTSGTLSFTIDAPPVTTTTTTTTTSTTTTTTSPSITTSSLPSGSTGTYYTNTLAATGGTTPYTWAVSAGTVPPGLALGGSTGTLFGTPTTAGTYSFTAEVKDSAAKSTTKSFSVGIVASATPLAISTASLPAGTEGTAYSQTLAATGGASPYAWSVSNGSVPPGLALGGSTGALSGTPSTSGSYSFTAQVKDSVGGASTKTFSVGIGAATVSTTPLAVDSTTVPSGITGKNYKAGLAASGGKAPYNWKLASGALPPGLTLGSDGSISGTPTAYGVSSFTAQVSDAGSVSQTVTYKLPVGASPITLDGGFESGTFSGKWSAVWTTTDVTINTDPTYVHSGKASMRMHYKICATCGAAHQDQNLYVAFQPGNWDGYPDGVSTVYIRAFVYFKHPEVGAAVDNIQRKIFYLQDQQSPANWSVVLDSFSSNGEMPLAVAYHDGGTGAQQLPFLGYSLKYDTWYQLQFGVVANTPGLKDGSLTVWVNGAQIWQQTGISIRGNFTSNINWMMIGQQSDRTNNDPVDEYRYLDDVVIDPQYIP
jgi:Putative Ig domain